MKKNILLAASLMIATSALAEISQTITIDEDQIDGFVKKIEFSGDNVILTYSDETQQTSDMELVSIAFEYTTESTGTAVEAIQAELTTDNRIYSLDGRYLGTDESSLTRGMYIRGGQKFIIK